MISPKLIKWWYTGVGLLTVKRSRLKVRLAKRR